MKRAFRKTEWWYRRVCPICGGDLSRYALVGHHVLPRRPFSNLSDDPRNIFIGCARPCCGHSLDRIPLAVRIVRIAHLLGLAKAVWARRECRRAKVPVKRTQYQHNYGGRSEL